MLNNTKDIYFYNKDDKEHVFSVLQFICNYLVKTYPLSFKYTKKGQYMQNCISNKSYPINNEKAIYTLGCLINQDV
jgi:hypothetical protein